MIKTRIKAALKAFIYPALLQRPPPPPPHVFPKPAPEPRIVLDNQLLAGKNVLITGAGKNCGRAIALEMAKQGANVFFTDFSDQACVSLEHELAVYPVKVKGFVADITHTAESDGIVEYLNQNTIRIDVLVNNVGRQVTGIGLAGLTVEAWQQTFQTNVFGPLYLTRLVAEQMIANGVQGSILFLTSIHQDVISRWPSYSASKAALAMLIKELAVELAPAMIRVNGIAPGWVVEEEHGQPLRHEYTPLHGCSIAPCYIGRAAVYLAADYFSAFTTGTVLKLDGGLSLYNHRVVQEPPVPNPTGG